MADYEWHDIVSAVLLSRRGEARDGVGLINASSAMPASSL